MRIVYVILFCIIFSFMDLLLAFIALLQSIIAVVSGQPNEALKDFGARLGIYLRQIAGFVSFDHDDMPFPFSDWPERDDANAGIAGADSADSTEHVESTESTEESKERTDSNG